MALKAWRELISPHRDVLEGTFQESEFAADLTKVANGTASPEYQDPALFFERTFVTEGMSLLLDSVVRRMAGSGGDPVVQLKTAFGGGKTHAMLAAYHLAKGEKPVSELLGVNSILDKARITDLPKARVAVLDGNALSPSQPRKRGSIVLNTLWGELAWQLGGEEGYRVVEQSDKDGTSPGKEILAELFSSFSPVVILMDETVAYIRQFESGKSYHGGTFDSNLTFMQSLTEAAGHVPTACVLASLPESDIEAGGERGKQALESIEHIFHRLESIWKPVATEEGFEIVRRRLFASIGNENDRDAVCRAFADIYAESNVYPAETKESSYYDRLKSSYPVHPEVFDRLYEDWATLENFQRTRGVLRLMAMIIHRLWSDGNKDLMIMPSSIPLYDVRVISELIRYLPQGWEPVIERDVDGQMSAPTKIDETNPLLGSVQAARRVARSIFLGSAPSGQGQRIRGINSERIRLACCQPNQQEGRYDDALRHLNDQLHYLNSGNERYWYDTQTNLRREAEDRMSRFDMDEHILPEIKKRLGSIFKGNSCFAGIHIFSGHEDIPDDTQLRLIILPPTKNHQKKDSFAIMLSKEIMSSRGNQPRLNQNRLIFLAADHNTTSSVYDQIKKYLAWQSILQDKDALNLDQHRIREASNNQKESDARLIAAIRETYKWILVPYQEKTKKGISDIQWEVVRISSVDQDPLDSIFRKLKEEELVIPQWAGIHLSGVLDEWYWKEDVNDVFLSVLWNDFCRYAYLPRLADENVFTNSVSDGIQIKDFFGYASGKDGERYVGLKFGSSAMVVIDKESVVVKKDVAEAQLIEEKDQEVEGEVTGDGDVAGGGVTGGGVTGGGVVPPKSKLKKHFYGTVSLKPDKAILDFDQIVREVVQHFSSKVDAKVKINIEIDAQSSKGFDEATQRTVKENSRTLGFKESEFEAE